MNQTQSELSHTRYLEDGFYIHPQPVIPQTMVDAAIVGMDEVRKGRYNTGTPPQPSQWQPGDDAATKLGKVEMPQLANHAIMALLQEPALGELVAQVTGAKALQIWWVQLLYKPTTLVNSATGPGIGWHQDRHYWRIWEEGSELFTAWVALSDVTADAGPMRFVRGSHSWGYVEGQSDFQNQADQAALRQQIQGTTGQGWEEVAAILPPGGVSIHHNLTYHGSSTNYSGAPRRSFAIHMRTEKSCPTSGVREGLTRFIDNLDYCPVIYGDAALLNID